MKYLLTVFSLSVLLSAVFAAEDCAVKGKDGDYNYNKLGNKGPANWGDLKPEYSACKDGKKQSPVDFPTGVKYDTMAMGPQPSIASPVMEFKAKPSNFELGCPTGADCGSTTIDGTKYTVANIHWHAPSEHTLNGRYYPLESHIVHANADGTAFIVIATMYDYAPSDSYMSKVYAGANKEWGQSPFIQSVLDNVAADKKSFPVDLKSIIDKSVGFCSYGGSLTTPPCTEAVTFYMSMHVPTVTRRQVLHYAVAAGASYDGTNRPLQPLNDRQITCYFN